MSISINHSTADKAHVLGLLGAGGKLTERQARALEGAREEARRSYGRSELPLPVTEALEHLVAGHADSTAEYAGNSYQRALQLLTAQCGSDLGTLATYSRAATFFGRLDEELAAAGVAAALLPGHYLFGGPPDEFPYIPGSTDGYPALGHLPLSLTKPAADAYRAALDRIDAAFRYDLELLIELLDIEHESWEYGTANLDWYTQDTVFFYLG